MTSAPHLCTNCGTSLEECNKKMKGRRTVCCGACSFTDTHGIVGPDGKDREPDPPVKSEWSVTMITRRPSGFGVAVMLVQTDQGTVQIPLMVSDLHKIARDAIIAMEPES